MEVSTTLDCYRTPVESPVLRHLTTDRAATARKALVTDVILAAMPASEKAVGLRRFTFRWDRHELKRALDLAAALSPLPPAMVRLRGELFTAGWSPMLEEGWHPDGEGVAA